jgi:hypothetical protein
MHHDPTIARTSFAMSSDQNWWVARARNWPLDFARAAQRNGMSTDNLSVRACCRLTG